MKNCKKCNITKPKKDFHKRISSHDGFKSSCKACDLTSLKEKADAEETEIRKAEVKAIKEAKNQRAKDRTVRDAKALKEESRIRYREAKKLREERTLREKEKQAKISGVKPSIVEQAKLKQDNFASKVFDEERVIKEIKLIRTIQFINDAIILNEDVTNFAEAKLRVNAACGHRKEAKKLKREKKLREATKIKEAKKLIKEIKLNKFSEEYKEQLIKEKKEKINTYYKNRLNNEPFYKMKWNIRNLLRNSIKGKGYGKNSKSEKIIGCSFEHFKNHIDKHFTEGMNWNNHGEWEFDHIIPVSSAKNEKELLKLNHYYNLRPLWKQDNLKKSGKHPYTLEFKDTKNAKLTFTINSDIDWFKKYRFDKLRNSLNKI